MLKIDTLDAIAEEMSPILATNLDNQSWQPILTTNLDMPEICLREPVKNYLAEFVR